MDGFTDDQGRRWGPRVTTQTLLRLRQETGVSIFRKLRESERALEDADPGLTEEERQKQAASNAFQAIFQDEGVMFVLLYLSVESVARERRVTMEALLDSLSSGELMTEALASVQEAITDFFRRGAPKRAPTAEAEESPEPGPGS